MNKGDNFSAALLPLGKLFESAFSRDKNCLCGLVMVMVWLSLVFRKIKNLVYYYAYQWSIYDRQKYQSLPMLGIDCTRAETLSINVVMYSYTDRDLNRL